MLAQLKKISIPRSICLIINKQIGFPIWVINNKVDKLRSFLFTPRLPLQHSLVTMQLIIKFVCATYSHFYIILFLFKSVNRRQIYIMIRAQADAIHNAKYLSHAEMYFSLWGIRFVLSLLQNGNAFCLSAKAQRPPLADVLSEVFHTFWCFSVVSSLPLACMAKRFRLCICSLLIFATFLRVSPYQNTWLSLKECLRNRLGRLKC